jgi:signal peptidase I
MHKIPAPRKPLLALLMSLILPGFGQLYNGELNKAIWLFIGFAFFSIPGAALIALHLPGPWMMPALLASLGVSLLAWLYGMIDAWRDARRAHDYIARDWQVSGTYALVLIACNAFALPLLIDYVREHQVESFRIPSSSMEPTILPGDILFADKRYNCPGCKQAIRRGDVAIFTYPNDRTLRYIKRIIGLPGDHVQIRGNAVSVNGVALKTRETATPDGVRVTEEAGGRQWETLWAKDQSPLSDASFTVPAGQVFVLGDRRDASKDSRNFGTVPLQDVIGRARQIWFSHGREGVRWERLGQLVN